MQGDGEVTQDSEMRDSVLGCQGRWEVRHEIQSANITGILVLKGPRPSLDGTIDG
jgi:alpha/beta superfamily hydrolase